MKTVWILFVIIMTAVLLGCSPSQAEAGDSKGSPSVEQQNPAATISHPKQLTGPLSQGEITPMPPTPPTPYHPNLQDLISKAVEDLAQRLSIPASQINVLKASDVIWPDSSLGCPQPDMAYADVLSPGYLILLNANGQDYEYHVGINSDIFYCEKPTPPVPGIPGDV